MMEKFSNSTISCVPPFVQFAAIAAMKNGLEERDRQMEEFRSKVELLVRELNEVPGVSCLMPGGSFYVFPSVARICNQNEITSHGLAMYLLEGACRKKGVACLGGECFGEAGSGFLRLSCAASDERLVEAVGFLAMAIRQTDRIRTYLDSHVDYQLKHKYDC
jgi:aspartate aminotransferase